MAVDPRSAPLDFSYRVQGSGPEIGLVFDDGSDVFIQPMQPLQPASLRAFGLPHFVQGPYLVVRGLSNRIELSTGMLEARTIVEYRGRARIETAALARLAIADINAAADNSTPSDSAHLPPGPSVPIAGVAIAETASVIAEAAAVALAVPAQVPASPPQDDALALAPSAARVTDTRLLFRPNHSVQSTLRHYLNAHGLAVEFRHMPVLMVEEFAEVSGGDVREVLRRALSRLGLRGEIQGNRLLVVELAR